HEMTAQEAAQLGVPEIEEAERKLAMISQSRDLRVQYERRMKAERDAVALTRDAWVTGVDEGKRLGMDEGKRLGLDEGKRLGLDAARNMLMTIIEARGLLINDRVRARIGAEQDLERLQQWAVRAALAQQGEDVLAD